MRHRAPRPFVDLFHRLARATAHRLGQVADRVPIRALGILMTASILGIGGYLAIASTTDGSSSRAIDPAAPTTADGVERPLTDQIPETDGRTPSRNAPEPSTSAPGESQTPQTPETPQAPSTTSEETSSSPTQPGPVSDDPSTPSTPSAPSTTRSARPSQPPTSQPSTSQPPSSTSPGDRTPPETSLSEEYPEPDAAQFSFSANERASFTCSLDGAAYTACDSPTLYTDLEPGWHTFSVRATDSAGNVDRSPASTRWHASNGNSEAE